MNFKITSLPIFADNFQYIIHNDKNSVVVDPGDAEVLFLFHHKHKLIPQAILLTHFHDDHMAGLAELMNHFPDLKIYGSSHIKECKWTIQSQKDITLLNDLNCQMIATPGHAREHVIFYFQQLELAFTGDLIFHLGCGRVFDGTMEELYQSLQLLKELPSSTKLYCSHDYGLRNQEFCKSLLSHAFDYSSYPQLHQIPLDLATEINWNPFLMAKSYENFVELRKRRNQF
ncbi:MAG: MBL fold metallo-hydrolase [Bdellovibrionia bacterium]